MRILTDDFGEVKLGSSLLPGIFESLEIASDGKIDEVEVKGSTKKKQNIVGFESSKIKLTIKLMTDDEGTCYDKLDAVEGLFKKSDKPGVYKIVNKHCEKRNINEVIFSKLRTYESNDDDIIYVTLDFEEYVPVKVQVKKKSVASKSAKTSSKTSSTTKSTKEMTIEDEMASIRKQTYKRKELTIQDEMQLARKNQMNKKNKIQSSPVKDTKFAFMKRIGGILG